jgi:hypothetical protein
MDKDVYGQHLRQHLASERRKTIPTTPASSNITMPSPPTTQIEMTPSSQLQFYS